MMVKCGSGTTYIIHSIIRLLEFLLWARLYAEHRIGCLQAAIHQAVSPDSWSNSHVPNRTWALV